MDLINCFGADFRLRHVILTLSALFIFSGITACEKPKKEVQYVSQNDFAQFRNMSQASPSEQDASRAVVRIQDSNSSGTGTFISNDGLLLSNDHVLGSENCVKEGCFITLDFNFQDNSSNHFAQTVFAKVKYADTGHDYTVSQIYYTSTVNGVLEASDKKYSYAYFLPIRTLPAAGFLRDENLRVIGHPLGVLKKIISVRVNDVSGTYVVLNRYVFPGNSGSPILDDQMRIVGIVHTSSFSLFDVGRNNIVGSTGGTASSAFPSNLLELARGDKMQGIGLDNYKSLDKLELKDDFYAAVNAGKIPASMGTVEGLVEKLANKCAELVEGDLSGKKILVGELDEDDNCGRMMALVACDYSKSDEGDEDSVFDYNRDTGLTPAENLKICPTGKLRDKIKGIAMNLAMNLQRDHGIFVHSLQDSFAELLADTETEYQERIAEYAKWAMTNGAPMSFSLASMLIEAEEHSPSSYNYFGGDLKTYVTNYQSRPYYANQAMDVASAAFRLMGQHKISGAQALGIVSSLKNDPQVSLSVAWTLEYLEFLIRKVRGELMASPVKN